MEAGADDERGVDEAEEVRFRSFLRRVNSSRLSDGSASIRASRLKSLIKRENTDVKVSHNFLISFNHSILTSTNASILFTTSLIVLAFLAWYTNE